ncbi:inhibitor of growth protein 3-like [Aedes albopictus]|uniref:PHD-type domain-containing protein n=1 Tax=Aedes albopictus TaxID=7160 RepID=A0ABM1XQJ3_AEDAL
MSGRESGKDGKSGSKGVRSNDKQSKVVEKSSDANVVVVVTEEGKDPDGVQKDDARVPEQDCTFCQEADNNGMVQCDRCDRWIHFACVGVTEEIADRSWSCPKCVAATWVQLSSSSTTNRLATGLSTGREQ